MLRAGRGPVQAMPARTVPQVHSDAMDELFAGWRFVVPRLLSAWRLLLVAAVGVIVAATLLAAVPIYSQSMATLGLRFRLANAVEQTPLNWLAVGNLSTQSPADLERRRAIDEMFEARLGWLGGETLVEEHTGRMTLTFERPSGTSEGTEDERPAPDWATFLFFISAFDDLTTVTAGRMPDPEGGPEVVLLDGFQRHASVGDVFTLSVGGFDDCNRLPPSEDPEERADEVQCRPTTRVAQSVTATIVGFVRPNDPQDPRWEIYDGRLEVPREAQFVSLAGLTSAERASAFIGVGSMPLFTTPEQLFGPLGAAMPLTGMRHRVGVVVDISTIGLNDVEPGIAAFAALRDDLIERLDLAAELAFPVSRQLAGFRNSLTFNQVPLLLILLQVVGIVIYYIAIVSSMLVERQAEEIGVYRSRGASTAQLVGLYLMEGIVIAIPAAVAAPWLASRVVAALGLTPTFQVMTGGALLPVIISPAAYLLGAGGALLALIAMLLPASVAARRGIVDVKAQQARPPGRSLIQRYYFDVAAAGFAAFLLWQLGRRGTVFDPDAVGGWSSDPMLLLSPFVFTLAVAGLVLRLYPPLLRWTAALLSTAGGTAVALGLRRAARAPATYARLLLLLVMAISVGTFAASYGPTVDRSHGDRIRYEAGADFRGSPTIVALSTAESDIADVRALDGVRDAALAHQGSIRTATGLAIPLLGVDAERAASLLWFRGDFAEEPLAALMRRLQSVVPSGGGVELPTDATSITVAVHGQKSRGRTLLWVRLRDGGGQYVNVRLGAPDFEGWRTMEAALPPDAVAPITFTGLLITDEQGAGTATPGAIFFDDVRALSANGARVLLDDFEGRFSWSMFGTRVGSSETFEVSEEEAVSGRYAMRWTWQLGLASGRRLLAMNDPNVPLAAIVSSNVAATLGAGPGTVATVLLDDVLIPIHVRAVVELFPTADPALGFVIVNRQHLQALAALLDVQEGRRPNELWLRFDAPLERQRELIALLQSDQSPLKVTSRAHHRDAEIAAVRADPTLRASGAGILTASFTAVVGLAALGFVVTLVLGAHSRTVEFAVLRAVGSSRLQILRSMVLEWGVVLMIGAVVGALLGRRVARVMLSFLDVTEDGTRVVPSFSLETDWATLGVGVGALVAVVALGLALSWASALRRATAGELRLTR